MEDTDLPAAGQSNLQSLIDSLSAGDIDASAEAARDITILPLTELMIWAIIGIALLNAISKLIWRATPMGTPLVDDFVAAQRERRELDKRSRPRHRYEDEDDE